MRTVSCRGRLGIGARRDKANCRLFYTTTVLCRLPRISRYQLTDSSSFQILPDTLFAEFPIPAIALRSAVPALGILHGHEHEHFLCAHVLHRRIISSRSHNYRRRHRNER